MENQSGGRPQLKKIKRPINRAAPQSAARNNNNTFGISGAPEAQSASRAPDVINDYLDVAVEPPSKDVREALFAEDVPVASSRQVSTHSVPASQPQYLGEDEYEEEVYGRKNVATSPDWLTSKILVLIASLCLFVGVIAGKFLFAESKVVRNGLQGVVVNAEVPRGRARCGVAERTQGCVLYIMNPQRQDMRAKDFYDLAAQMTGRQRFMIETGNMRYANSKIKPGDIVQLNIPPL